MTRTFRKNLKKIFPSICKICEDYGDIFHHVIPRSFGGKEKKDNMIILCEICHGKLHEYYRRKAQEIMFRKDKNYFQDCIMDLIKAHQIIKRSMAGKDKKQN